MLPADILGSVYEQFLGKVITLTAGHRAVVEDKPEVKKAGGVFYTPTYIVDYIVRQTVGPIIEGKTPKQIESIRILDPACGSGSFLIVAYQFLLDWYHRYYISHDPEKLTKGKAAVLVAARGGGWALTTAERKRILVTHIFGVDIDSQAVEVTKLSLLLKVLEGETAQSVQLELIHQRVLPDLGDNIKCGNSLIGSDFYAQPGLPAMDADAHLRVNVFDWDGKDGFPEIMRDGGFDAVVGNPPYGATFSESEGIYLNAGFESQNYRLDSYLLFIERSLRLAKNKGRIAMIIPNTWLLNLQTTAIRKRLFSHTTVTEVVHFTKKVFAQATVDTEIFVLLNSKPEDSHDVEITISDTHNLLASHKIPQLRWRLGDGRPVNILERPEANKISERLSKFEKLDSLFVVTQGTKPFQVGKGVPKQTREIVDQKPFVSVTKKDAGFRPLLRGSLIHRYQQFWNNDYWISYGPWLAEQRVSASHDSTEKIVIRQTGDSFIATLDRERFVARDNLYTIVPRKPELDLSVLLALLNSRFASWLYQNTINPEKGEALAQVKRGHLAIFPIPLGVIEPVSNTDVAAHDLIVSLVDKMLDLHRQRAVVKTPHEQTSLDRQISATDTQIDRLVYDIYRLTDEEIKLVEKDCRC